MDEIKIKHPQFINPKISGLAPLFSPITEKSNEDSIVILDPEIIGQSRNIIDELAQFGLNHLTRDPKLGWNYILDHVWMTEQLGRYITDNTSRSLKILEVGCGKSRFHNFLEKKFGINIIGIDRPEGYCHQANMTNIDYCVDFVEMDAFGNNSVDVIFWLSAIEHNKPEKIRQLVEKSMSLLKEGGLFLATFAISEHTHWFNESEQTNLSTKDSMDIFNVTNLHGDLDSIKEKYRSNMLFLRDKYEQRYKKFGFNDPDFVVAATRRLKTKNKVNNLPLQTIPRDNDDLYLFLPSNETHVHWMYPLAKTLPNSRFMVIQEKNENADFYLNSLSEEYFTYQNGILNRIKPSVVVFGCDWGGYEQQVLNEAKSLGIPTVCIQEGCLDFMDQRANRMLRSDYAFLQGPIMRNYIRRQHNVIVTGNPKYDSLYEIPLPEKVTVMVNSNFTYKIYEESREQWIRDVVESCRELGLDFFISQHPRDKGVFPPEYPVYKSDAFKMQQQLQNTSILVSRFSTVIYEALAMGREVVYYNPHREPFRIFAQDKTGGISIANDRSELLRTIRSKVENFGNNNENRRNFLLQHCNTLNHDATNKCSEALRTIILQDTSKIAIPSQKGSVKRHLESDNRPSETPTVSVIIPCYNAAKYLGQAIESVLSQTFSDFEIIIVDDGSVDNTAQVADSFSDPRIKYFKHPENRGLSATRNTGIQNSRGKYICFLDADDYFLPHKLKDQVNFLDRYKIYGLVGGGYLRVDENGNVLKEHKPADNPVIPEDLMVVNQFVAHSTLIRREYIEKAGYFDEELKGGEEWDFHCRLALAGCLMYRQSNVVCAYRFVENSLSTDLQLQTNSRFKVIEKAFGSQNLKPELLDIKYHAIAYTHLKAAGQYYSLKKFDRANYHLIQTLIADPSQSRNDYENVIRMILFYMDHAWIDSPAEYINTIFNSMPTELRELKKLQKKVAYRALSSRILSSYKDKHRGNRCVIISNGQSLKKMDLSFLKNEITFGLDCIYNHLDSNNFSPTYYICLNSPLIDRDFIEICGLSSEKFLNLDVVPYISDPNGIIFLRMDRNLNFVLDPSEMLGQNGSTTFMAIQLAYFMGFEEVILIGDDHNFTGEINDIPQDIPTEFETNNNESDNTTLKIKRSSLGIETNRLGYRLAKEVFETVGRRIINATVDSKYSILPTADYRQIFFAGAPLANSGQKTQYEHIQNSNLTFGNKPNQHDITKTDTSYIKYRTPGSKIKPDTVTNIFSIACSYEKLGYSEIAKTLFEQILKPMQHIIDNINTTRDPNLEDYYEIEACYISTSTKLAQCYTKQGAWDKVKQIYLNLLKQQNIGLSQHQKQDITNVLKKLEGAKIPQTVPENSYSNQSEAIKEMHKFTTDNPDLTNNNDFYKNKVQNNIVQNQAIDPNQIKQQASQNGTIRKEQRQLLSEPPVSVIMPVYNGAEHIAAAIESVLTQNYRNFELVIINDGSTDNTEEIVAGFKDERIKYFRQENRGLAGAHNAGIKQSQGEFVIKLDSDDMMAQDFISRHIQEFENHPEADLVYCNDCLIDENSKPIRVIESPEYTDRKLLIRDLFRCGYPIVPFRTCIRKNVFDKIGFFDESLSVAEDYDMIRRFVQHGLKVHHLPDALYLRRMGFDSLSRNFNTQKAKSHFEVVKRFGDTFRHDELFPDVDWKNIAPERIKLHAGCLVASTYLAMGQAHRNAKSPPYYVKMAFEMACQQLNDCLKLNPENRQISELLQKCKRGQEMYVAQFQEAVS